MSVLSFYKPIDPIKIGLSSGGGPFLGLQQWAPATAYAAGAVVQSGNYWFKTTAGGISAAGPGPSFNTLVDNAVTWVYGGPISSFAVQDATQQQELGIIAEGKDFSSNNYGVAEFMYVKFSGTVNPGDFVIVNRQGFTCVQTPAAAPGASKFSEIAISMGAQVAGTFGWVMIRGVCDTANAAAALTVGNVLTGSGTAGQAGQATANYIFDGAVLRAAGVVGTVTAELYWPACSGR